MNFVEARDDTACSDQESQDSSFSTFPCETSEKRLPAKTTQSGDRELTSSSKSSPLRGMRKERREKRLFSLCEETSSDRKKTLCPLLRKTLDQRLGKLIVCSNIDNLHTASSLRIPSLSHSRRKAHTDTTPTPPPHRTPGDHPAQPRRLRRPFLVVAGRARFRPFSGCSKDKRFRRLKITNLPVVGRSVFPEGAVFPSILVHSINKSTFYEREKDQKEDFADKFNLSADATATTVRYRISETDIANLPMYAINVQEARPTPRMGRKGARCSRHRLTRHAIFPRPA